MDKANIARTRTYSKKTLNKICKAIDEKRHRERVELSLVPLPDLKVLNSVIALPLDERLEFNRRLYLLTQEAVKSKLEAAQTGDIDPLDIAWLNKVAATTSTLDKNISKLEAEKADITISETFDVFS